MIQRKDSSTTSNRNSFIGFGRKIRGRQLRVISNTSTKMTRSAD
jgi:hypothetical protein